MSIKFEKDPTDFIVQPGDSLVKSNIMKSELDAQTAELGAGHPYDSLDVDQWSAVRAAGYSMKIKPEGFSIHKDDREIGSVGNSNPGVNLTAHEMRNAFKQAVGIATNHQATEASKMQRDGIAPKFLSGEVWGEEGEVPSSLEAVNIHDGAPLAEVKDEAVPEDANGGEGTEKSFWTEDDLLAKSEPVGQKNQGWVVEKAKGSEEDEGAASARAAEMKSHKDRIAYGKANEPIITHGFKDYNTMKETHDVIWVGDGRIAWKPKKNPGKTIEPIVEQPPKK